jgi:hypothetical protein
MHATLLNFSEEPCVFVCLNITQKSPGPLEKRNTACGVLSRQNGKVLRAVDTLVGVFLRSLSFRFVMACVGISDTNVRDDVADRVDVG